MVGLLPVGLRCECTSEYSLSGSATECAIMCLHMFVCKTYTLTPDNAPKSRLCGSTLDCSSAQGRKMKIQILHTDLYYMLYDTELESCLDNLPMLGILHAEIAAIACKLSLPAGVPCGRG